MFETIQRVATVGGNEAEAGVSGRSKARAGDGMRTRQGLAAIAGVVLLTGTMVGAAPAPAKEAKEATEPEWTRVAASNAPRGPAATSRSQAYYVMMPHADDEALGWGWVEDLPDSIYTVFVTFTRGEGSNSCIPSHEAGVETEAGVAVSSQFASAEAPLAQAQLPGNFDALLPEDRPIGTKMEVSTGPYKYEGPGSPVGEPDEGERHPLGDPWVGQFTQACGDARMASWHWFLDDAHEIDGVGTNLKIVEDPWLDDDYRGGFCPPPGTFSLDGIDSPPVPPASGCVDVWADGDGARVVFDLGNAAIDSEWKFLPARFDVDDVAAAVAALRENRRDWGLPKLPEVGGLSAETHQDDNCYPSLWNPDHSVVANALRHVDLDIGEQVGAAACAKDPHLDGAERHDRPMEVSAAVAWNLVEPLTGYRIGPQVVNYGWKFPSYRFFGCVHECLYWRLPNGPGETDG